ncbi:MAG: PIN domain nuclease [Spirochaetaceae bacterium]|jgi:predicted nucleic acid-binding protein|nr:PIN domain nuclease [Spirochaetaceae bacterium]
MKKLKIYLDTTIISYLDQKEKPERMADTHLLWEKIKAGMFDTVISDICIAEINGCSAEKRNVLYNYLSQINYTLITSDEKSIGIAAKMVDLQVLTQKSFLDCQHIANAIVSGCDAIVSWNFRHIVNHKTIMGVKAVTALEGYTDLLIYAPPILIAGEDDDT